MALADLKDFQQPVDIGAAIALRQQWGDRALIVAGGTFIHGLAARGLLSDIEMIVDISRLRLDAIELGREGLRIGATATYGALGASGVVTAEGRYGALVDAMAYPPPQILNVATVGGSLAASCPLFDLPVAMAALDAEVIAHGPRGERRYPIDRFFTGLFASALGEDEILVAAVIPAGEKSVSGFAKLETNANDLALVNAAASLTFSKSLLGRKYKCTQARVWVGGGVGEAICSLPSVEAALSGRDELTDEVIAAAARASAADVQAQGDHRASAKYRQKMIAVYVEKAIRQALERLG